MKYTAHGHLTVSLSVTVDIPDEELEGLSKDSINDLVRERAEEAEAVPSELCVHCSGYTSGRYGGRADDGSSYSLELDGAWRITEVEKS